MFRNTLLIMALSIGFVGEAYSQAVARSAKPRGMQTFREAPMRTQRQIVDSLYRASGRTNPHPSSIERTRQDLADISLPLLNAFINQYGVTYNTLVRNSNVRQSLKGVTGLGPVAVNAAQAVGLAFSQTKSALNRSGKLTPEMTELLIQARDGQLELVASLRNSEQAKAASVESIQTFFKEGFAEGRVDSGKRALEMLAEVKTEVKAGKSIPEAKNDAIQAIMRTNSELAERINNMTPEQRREFNRRCVI